MPSEPTDEQLEIRRKGRQRLIGAVALALLAVVFLPMLLDPEPRRERAEPMLAIPPREGVPPLPAAPVPAPAPSRAEAPKTEPAQAPLPASAQAPVGSAESPATSEARKTVEPKAPEFKRAATRSAEPKGAPTKREPAAEGAAPKLEGFAIQVGAFKDEARLKQAREKLAAAGISHFIDRQPDFTRLRAGPYATREAAEKALAGVKRAGFDGRVVSLP